MNGVETSRSIKARKNKRSKIRRDLAVLLERYANSDARPSPSTLVLLRLSFARVSFPPLQDTPGLLAAVRYPAERMRELM